MVFPQLCHGCGSCSLICPNQSITEEPIKIGALEQGHTASGIIFGRGVLNPGEPMAVPIIRQLKQWMKPQSSQTLIIDAPPGTSCPVVEAMRGADIVLLVAEPTPFGLHDLRLAVGVARELDIPVGVVVNRDGIGDDRVDTFCEEEDLPILLRIPFDRALAEGIARGLPLIDISPDYEDAFRSLHRQAADIVHQHHDEHRYYQPAVSHQKGERV
jgi:MinD superfamily P-loop ATPase